MVWYLIPTRPNRRGRVVRAPRIPVARRSRPARASLFGSSWRWGESQRGSRGGPFTKSSKAPTDRNSHPVVPTLHPLLLVTCVTSRRRTLTCLSVSPKISPVPAHDRPDHLALPHPRNARWGWHGRRLSSQGP